MKTEEVCPARWRSIELFNIDTGAKQGCEIAPTGLRRGMKHPYRSVPAYTRNHSPLHTSYIIRFGMLRKYLKLNDHMIVTILKNDEGLTVAISMGSVCS